MGTFFIIVVSILTLLAVIGLFLEIGFWRDQSKTIAYLSDELLTTDPVSIRDWLNTVLPQSHPLRPPLNRILATDHSPEASVDLIEPNEAHVRFLSGVRRYAVSVVLLCGIAGTLFSLHAAIPANGIFDSFEPNGTPSILKYQENFRQLQPALANAFWPSIFGVISTLLLQAIRFAFLDPAQHKAGRDFVALASSALIPWTLRHQEVSSAATNAASKLECAANAFASAAQSGAEAVSTGSEAAKKLFDNFGAAASEGCRQLSEAFQNSAEQIGGAGSSAVSTIEGSAKEVARTMSELGTALAPIVQRMESVAKALGTASDRFDKSVASNGPFLKAMEQLYDASSPAEKRYEQLLVAVAKMQELSTTQNADLLRLHQETAGLAKSAVQTAEESTRLAQSLQTATASLPATAQAVTAHSNVLTTLTKQWQSEVSSLTSEFRSFSTDVKTVAGTQRQLANELLTQLPTMIAEALAAKLPNELGPLVNSATVAGQRTGDLHDGIRSLQTSIESLRKEMSQIGVGPSSTASSPTIRRKKKWYQLWKR
jgi:ABC-type transporter Mla subunit MlaD